MKAKTGLQLYSVRKELTVSFENTLEAISRMGFEVVERLCATTTTILNFSQSGARVGLIYLWHNLIMK